MSENKKFTIRLTEKRNGWSAEIIRQVTSRRTVVSKREMGFESQELAQAWADKELAGFIENQAKRNERKAEARAAIVDAGLARPLREQRRRIVDGETLAQVEGGRPMAHADEEQPHVATTCTPITAASRIPNATVVPAAADRAVRGRPNRTATIDA